MNRMATEQEAIDAGLTVLTADGVPPVESPDVVAARVSRQMDELAAMVDQLLRDGTAARRVLEIVRDHLGQAHVELDLLALELAVGEAA